MKCEITIEISMDEEDSITAWKWRAEGEKLSRTQEMGEAMLKRALDFIAEHKE